MTELIAVMALIAFMLAWLAQTVIVLEKRKNLGDIIVNMLFFTGLILFTFHSFSIADPWFIIFNSISTVLAFINLYYVPNKMRALKRDVMGAEHFIEKEVTGYRQTYRHRSRRKK